MYFRDQLIVDQMIDDHLLCPKIKKPHSSMCSMFRSSTVCFQ